MGSEGEQLWVMRTDRQTVIVGSAMRE